MACLQQAALAWAQPTPAPSRLFGLILFLFSGLVEAVSSTAEDGGGAILRSGKALALGMGTWANRKTQGLIGRLFPMYT